MKPRHRPDDDFDDNDDEEKSPESEGDEPKKDSAGRNRGPFGGGGRPMPDLSRRDDDELVMVIRPDGSRGLMARSDPQGFIFVQFDVAGRVKRTLESNNKRKPR